MVTVLDVRAVAGSGGGPEKTILNSPRHLAGTGYRHVPCFLHSADDDGFDTIRRRAEQKDCQLLTIAERSSFSPAAVYRVHQAVRQLGAQIWHGHDYKTNLLGVLLRPVLGFKLVTTLHGWVDMRGRLPLYYRMDRALLPLFDQVIAVSPDLRDAALRARVRPERLHLIENAIDTDEFRRTAPAALQDRPGVPAGRLLIGAVGRLSQEKGFDLLIDAVRQLVDEGHDLALWIAGEGPLEAALRSQVERLDLQDRVTLLGFADDTRRLFACFDIFCLSSLREGLPNVVLEAMAMEVPVVATRCGGMESLSAQGQDCVLVDAGSVQALVDGLRRLSTDHGLRQALQARARSRIERDYSFANRMARVVQVYDMLGLRRRIELPAPA